MKISVVIPAFNEEKLLPRTLGALGKALEAFRERGWATEVIVCDNNSTDGTASVARGFGAEVVFEPVNQIARARNAGAAVAKGDWILFLDADSIPTRELLAAAAEHIAGGRVLFIGAVVQLDEDIPATARVFVRCWNWLSRTLGWMAGSFVLVQAGAFREVGGFSLELYAGEEVELSRRLKALARRRKLGVVIISRHPLTSSARRMRLYSQREIFRFALRAVWRPRATPKSREACGMWYDGKR